MTARPSLHERQRRGVAILSELHRLRSLLAENRLDFFRRQHLPRIVKMLPTYRLPSASLPRGWSGMDVTARAEWVMQEVIAADPDPLKKHANWLLNLFAKGLIPWEDLVKATDYLTRFMEAKREGTIPRSTNIEQVKSLGALYSLLAQGEQAVQTADEGERQAALRQSRVLLDDPDYLVLVPETEEAAKFFGRDTEWCTAWGCQKGRHPKRENKFEDYKGMGHLYFVLDKRTGQRRQIHLEAGQWMDEADKPLDTRDLYREHQKVVAAIYDDARENQTEMVQRLVPDLAAAFPDADFFIGPGGLRALSLSLTTPPDLSVSIDANKRITGVHSKHTDSHGYAMLPAKILWPLVRLMEHLGYKGNSRLLANEGIFWNKGQFGSIEQVGDVLHRFPDGWMWRQAISENLAYLALFDEGRTERLSGHIVLRGNETDGPTGQFKVNKTRMGWEERRDLGVRVAALALSDNRIVSFDPETAITAEDFPVSQKKATVEAKPSLATLNMFMELEGATERVRQRITQHYASLEQKLEWVQIDGAWRAKVEEWRHVHHIGRVATHRFRRVLDGATGAGSDYGTGRMDKDGKSALLSELLYHVQDADPDLFQRVAADVEGRLTDRELAEWFEDGFHPDVPEIVTAAVNCASAEWLVEDAMSADYDGWKAGAEKEAAAVLAAAFKPWFFFDAGGGEWSSEFSWDAKIALMVPPDKLARLVAEGEDEGVQAQGWLQTLDVRPDAQVPYDGWSGYDTEVAQRGFRDQILSSLSAEQ